MTETVRDESSVKVAVPVASPPPIRPERALNVAMLVSAIRCTLTYVLLPFALPLLGLAPGVGPLLGITIGTIAIAANVFSVRRFWRAEHRWRRPVTALHAGVIVLLLVLIVLDLGTLTS